MKIKELKDKDDAGLNEQLLEMQKHLFNLRNQAVTEKLEDPSQIGKTKRDIARVKTILRKRVIESAAKA